MGGVVGVIDDGKAAECTASCLAGLQHRGGGGGCIACRVYGHSCGDQKPVYSRMFFSGFVTDRLHDEMGDFLIQQSQTGETDKLNTYFAVGEVSGPKHYKNACSTLDSKFGVLSLVLSCYIENLAELQDTLLRQGAVLSDKNNPTEIIANLISKAGHGDGLHDSLVKAMAEVKGRFGLVVATDDGIYAARDRHGREPLSIYRNGSNTTVASESCVFPEDAFEDIEPGTIVFAGRDGAPYKKRFAGADEKRCLRELVWRAKPTSTVYGESVSVFRDWCGQRLAHLYGGNFDGYSFTAVPDSAVHIGEGFGRASEIPQTKALIRKHSIRYVEGRTPVSAKLEVDRSMVKKKMVLVEDSLNFGDTATDINKMLRSAGAEDVCLLSASPPGRLCKYRMAPNRKLIAERVQSEQEMIRELGVDGFFYLGVEDLLKGLKEPGKYCTECFS